MPLYEYRCEQGHVTDLLRPMAQGNDPAACGTCGAEAHRIVSLTAVGVVKGSSTPVRTKTTPRPGFVEVSPGVWEKGSSIDASKVVDWRCAGCGKVGVAVDEPLPECCGEVAPYVNEKVAHKDWFPVGGYFDRGLGVYFNSRTERSEYAKAHGLVEGSGINDDTERALSIRAAEERKVDDFWLEECRQAAAAGERDAVPQWIKDEVGWKD